MKSSVFNDVCGCFVIECAAISNLYLSRPVTIMIFSSNTSEGMEELQERLALLETQKDDERRVESQTAENATELVDIHLELMEIRQDVDELKMKADTVERGELVDTVKNDVLEYMRIRLWGDD
jgi:predicted  nucleic acid-binding Zn-ribbon protein